MKQREKRRMTTKAAAGPRYSKEEFARRGEEIFERDIRPHVAGRDKYDVVAIDIETGAYEVDPNEDVAADRLTARIPDAQVWVRRVGFPYVRRFGGRGLSGVK
jgi:hypothetical protein